MPSEVTPATWATIYTLFAVGFLIYGVYVGYRSVMLAGAIVLALVSLYWISKSWKEDE